MKENMQKAVSTVEKIIEELCLIPAPLGKERERALYCQRFLERAGAKGVYVDSEDNAVYPVMVDGDTTLFVAHTDTVFPFDTPIAMKREGEYLVCPGVGDDTSGVAVLLAVAQRIASEKIKAKSGVIFAFTSGEEGLGNLKGIRKIMSDFKGKIKRVYAFDGRYDEVATKCVGSERYEIEFKAKGGHSYLDFGSPSAINAMAKFICAIEEVKLPEKEDTKTTFNVGVVSGGTSVNTIAESAKMLYEYRSDDEDGLSFMREFFEQKVKDYDGLNGATVTVKKIGSRPCGSAVDELELTRMVEKAVNVSEKYSQLKCKKVSSSTDCNIPMSQGIPAVCVGTYFGEGQHTLGEKILVKSVGIGLSIVSEIIMEYFE